MVKKKKAKTLYCPICEETKFWKNLDQIEEESLLQCENCLTLDRAIEFYKKRLKKIKKADVIEKAVEITEKDNLKCCGNCFFNDNCHKLDEIFYVCKDWKYDGLEKIQRLLEEAQDER